MGKFKRTNKGLSNLRLFYNVDYVVYLEGGNKSYTKEEVLQNKFNNDTEDIAFWSRIFSKYRKNIKLKYKSVGSKKTLKDLVEDVLSGDIVNVYIAMDNEFDEILNKRIIHPNIFYTYGYSYENDVWNENTIISVLEELTASNIDTSYITNGFKKFQKDIKKSIFADAYMFKKNLSFFPRKQGHLFCIECNSNNFPNVKIDEVQKLMGKHSLKENTIKSYGYRNKIEVIKFCFGHLLADYCCQIINHYIRLKHNFSSVKKEILYRMGIKKYFDKQYNNSTISNYYKGQFA
ncbi:DUF4435 domain-containing protein [Elizabethkingia meningoseptica]|uniref:DUF4435 domain-containing protein n=1 Tax=Elizabethkingia meningoseptica TaxID=238 RepID=UPI0022F1A8F3|nr:DUF4435 domain-containing protein [Elizabethkingia meningoseptica]EJK5327777.1 DUF4435 domain-containing protein [Elizabethkingia meningoseptica]MDE5436348.1 DUF4435 domain-containing protein [Elizabethkingia meningoseptica]MDE5508452.1 DUF4435 domain-containing protein [Elizabethkingia meningoseptica]MDE5515159.1 DUF4435 domain-containing protein [Elizabethkingia meningoseptica]MDE5529425.1 DUF4435 domain-containing protein [Elizabethkingia meningoseptica]